MIEELAPTRANGNVGSVVQSTAALLGPQFIGDWVPFHPWSLGCSSLRRSLLEMTNPF